VSKDIRWTRNYVGIEVFEDENAAKNFMLAVRWTFRWPLKLISL